MPTYLHPGVYIEEIPSGSKPIEGVSTSTAAFVGQASRGPTNATVEEACLQLRKWLDDFIESQTRERQTRGDDEVTRQ